MPVYVLKSGKIAHTSTTSLFMASRPRSHVWSRKPLVINFRFDIEKKNASESFSYTFCAHMYYYPSENIDAHASFN